MVKRNRWLDVTPNGSKASANRGTQSDQWLTGTVAEQIDSSTVAVEVDGSDSTPVVAPATAGITYIGASVRLLRDSTGRIIQVEAPLDLPDGVEVIPVGSTGKWMAAESSRHDADIGATRDALDAAKAELEAAKAKLEDPETGLAAAQQKADDALAAAVGASQTAEQALDTAVLRIDSSRGLVFKNSMVSTVLTVTVIRGGEPITNIVDLQAAYGPGAYLEWSWKRLDESDFGVLSSADTRISQGGFTLTVSPADVDTKVVFMCSLNA